jgi:hypothetical protein
VTSTGTSIRCFPPVPAGNSGYSSGMPELRCFLNTWLGSLIMLAAARLGESTSTAARCLDSLCCGLAANVGVADSCFVTSAACLGAYTAGVSGFSIIRWLNICRRCSALSRKLRGARNSVDRSGARPITCGVTSRSLRALANRLRLPFVTSASEIEAAGVASWRRGRRGVNSEIDMVFLF